jgi:hypothetical protein
MFRSEHDPEINPWIQLMRKMITCGDDGETFLGLITNTAISTALGVKVIMVLLSNVCGDL